MTEAFGRLSWHYDLSSIIAIGHRVVHGGDLFDGPVLIGDETMAQMEGLVPLAPLHQPQALRLIRALARLRPEIRQTASFDTAFHRTNADVVRRFALPRKLHEDGIKRYGFHGLSYRSIAGDLARNWPDHAPGKWLSPISGRRQPLRHGQWCQSRHQHGVLDTRRVPMATRCGALDAGPVLHLNKTGLLLPLGEIEDLVYHRSGLLDVSGISADSRALLESDELQAKEAIELFSFQVAGEIARLASKLGGLDTLVFTAGIGEHQPAIRADICTRLMWLGIDTDPVANAENRPAISTPASRFAVLVIPTDEEQVIAADALRVLGG